MCEMQATGTRFDLPSGVDLFGDGQSIQAKSKSGNSEQDSEESPELVCL